MLQDLTEMGFAEPEARVALVQAHGDLKEAVKALVRGECAM